MYYNNFEGKTLATSNFWRIIICFNPLHWRNIYKLHLFRRTRSICISVEIVFFEKYFQKSIVESVKKLLPEITSRKYFYHGQGSGSLIIIFQRLRTVLWSLNTHFITHILLKISLFCSDHILMSRMNFIVQYNLKLSAIYPTSKFE